MIRPDDKILREYNVLYKPDSDFASHARLLQSKWRVKKGLQINDTKKSDYGNFVKTDIAIKDKVNFLTENIKRLITYKIPEIRSNGGLVGEPRIWNNLLSSQPLCFNLFGELHYDLDLATKFFQQLFPDRVSLVTKIDFEYSSKRNKPDNSAFDVYVEYLNDQKKCFFGIEVKYQENLREEKPSKAAYIFKKHKNDYFKLIEESGFYKANSIEKLQYIPLAQIWRDHLLSFNMSDENITGSFIFLYPFNNDQCGNAVAAYQTCLASSNEDVSKFYPRDLNDFIRTLNKIHDTSWTRDLVERYIGI